MSLSQANEVLTRIEELASECGIEGEHNLATSQFVVCFGLPNDRTQEVYVSDTSIEPEIPVIAVHSTCLVVDKGLFKGISKPMALELLLLNERLNFARFGIQEDEKSYIIVVSYDLLLNTLDAEGFKAALECVALAADGYEAKFDQDVF